MTTATLVHTLTIDDLPRLAARTRLAGELIDRDGRNWCTEPKTTAARIRLAGELIDRDGTTAWTTTDDWTYGPRAANTQPSHQNRTDDDGYPITLNDPTGDGAVDPTAGADSYHPELVEALGWLDTAARQLVDAARHRTTPEPETIERLLGWADYLIGLLAVATPHMPIARKELVLASLVDEGWCTSCYRDRKYHQPIDTKKDGTPYYRDLCKWCGEFKGNHKILPPIELLDLHHQSRRISPRILEEALRRHRSAKPKPKRKKASRR
jgi:hypothetical protein